MANLFFKAMVRYVELSNLTNYQSLAYSAFVDYIKRKKIR